MIDWVELSRSMHGHVGVLAAAALLHPAIFLRPGRPLSRGQRWAVGAGAGLVGAVYASGLALYPGYRERERPALMQQDFALALWFERKEHLAFAAVVLAGTAALMVLSRRDGTHHRTARWMLGVSAALVLVAVGVGSVVGAWTR
ncbi:MAG: hypothetical protein FJ090_01605 [Deltaproteobacteria bacterium]|nr:hypothetical protein [Deltaproteobacteria bacterium]